MYNIVKQGNNSSVEKINGRLYKTIHCDDFGPYDEYQILKKVSLLGPEFPQNVLCEGEYKLSYDYIEGITLEEFLQCSKINENDQVLIFIQLLSINMKLIKNGIELCDQVLSNFIVDCHSVIHAIDFGYVQLHDDGEYFSCLDKAVNTWYKNGLINEDLLTLYQESEDVMLLIEYLNTKL